MNTTKDNHELWNKSEHWHESIRAKLDGLLETNQFANFEKCGKEVLFKSCAECGKTEILTYRCSIRWCPRCNWRLARARSEMLTAWTRQIKQPKHLTLTQRNTDTFTRRTLRTHLKNLQRLRRSKFWKAANVKGGCLSVEVTNETQGWHLHSHWLIDCRWMDAGKLAVEWGKIVGQDYAIVKVQDARARDYVLQVCKYVVKGNELAAWPAEQIHQFVNAIRGRRMFFVFGSLAQKTDAVKLQLAKGREHTHRICECGCDKFTLETEVASILKEIRGRRRRR